MIDECLSRYVAHALKAVGWPTISASDEIQGEKDPEVIPWCRAHNRAWVTIDNEARRRHHADLIRYPIDVLWVGVPKGQKFTPIYELAILSHAIGHFDVKRANSPNKHSIFKSAGDSTRI